MADSKIEETVKEALEMYRPMLQADGGDCELINIDEENRVHLKLKVQDFALLLKPPQMQKEKTIIRLAVFTVRKKTAIKDIRTS